MRNISVLATFAMVLYATVAVVLPAEAAPEDAVQSRVIVSPINYQLTDLKTGNDTTAGLAWLGDRGWIKTGIHLPDQQAFVQTYNGFYSTVTGSGDSSASATVSTNWFSVGSALSLAHVQDGYTFSMATLERPFSLAPHTAISFAAHVVGETFQYGLGDPVKIWTNSQGGLGIYDALGHEFDLEYWQVNRISNGPAEQLHAAFGVSYSNNSDQPVNLMFSIFASSISIMSAVPEPSAFVSLLSGLLLLSALTRLGSFRTWGRRKTKAAQAIIRAIRRTETGCRTGR